MARTIGTDFATQLASSQTRPFYAVEFFYAQPLRIWTGYGEFRIAGQIYVGLGNLLSISNVVESGETKASGISLSVSGLDTSVLSASLNETQQGIVANIYFGVLTTANNAQSIVDDPYTIFSGSVDTVSIEEDGETSSIGFNIESKMISLERPLEFRYTDQDQKFFFPNDKGLEFVDKLQDKTTIWGGN